MVDWNGYVLMEGGQLEVEIGPDLDLIMTGPVEECSKERSARS